MKTQVNKQIKEPDAQTIIDEVTAEQDAKFDFSSVPVDAEADDKVLVKDCKEKKGMSSGVKKIGAKPIILDDNPVSILSYAEEHPETFKDICDSMEDEK